MQACWKQPAPNRPRQPPRHPAPLSDPAPIRWSASCAASTLLAFRQAAQMWTRWTPARLAQGSPSTKGAEARRKAKAFWDRGQCLLEAERLYQLAWLLAGVRHTPGWRAREPQRRRYGARNEASIKLWNQASADRTSCWASSILRQPFERGQQRCCRGAEAGARQPAAQELNKLVQSKAGH